MLCKVCNTDNNPGAAFCQNCGATLEQEPVATQNHSEVITTSVTDPGKTMNIIALILGIAAMVFGAICPCSCGYLAWIGYILVPLLAIGSIILGIIGMKKSKEACFDGKMGMVGMILGIAAVAVLVIMSIIAIIFSGALAVIYTALMAHSGEFY